MSFRVNDIVYVKEYRTNGVVRKVHPCADAYGSPYPRNDLVVVELLPPARSTATRDHGVPNSTAQKEQFVTLVRRGNDIDREAVDEEAPPAAKAP